MTTTETFPSLLEAIEEIRALGAHYSYAVDEGTPEEWAATFSKDGVFHALIPGQTPRGHAELLGRLGGGCHDRGAPRRFGAERGIRHDDRPLRRDVERERRQEKCGKVAV